MKKNLLLSLFFFIAGFFVHALLVPDFMANGIVDVKNIVIPNSQTEEQQNDPLITKVTFDGKKFSRNNITVGFTRYISIVNTSNNTLMWLISTTPELATTRGFGESEAVQMQFNKKGQYVVADKNNPDEKLIITVK